MFQCETSLDFLNVEIAQISKIDYFMPKFKLSLNGFKMAMFRGGTFYAVYDPDTGFWYESESKAQELIDKELIKVSNEWKRKNPDANPPSVALVSSNQNANDRWQKFYNKTFHEDNYHPLDTKPTFHSDEVSCEDYRTKRLSYDPVAGDTSAWDTLLGTLYAEDQTKIEYAIGSIADGPHIRDIQKYYVLYGAGGTGKSTVIDILNEVLFPGLCGSFNPDEMAGSSQFPIQSLQKAKIVAYAHEADLSKLQSNAMFNAIACGNPVSMNVKNLQAYETTLPCTMFIATNKPVAITDRLAGSVRRIIDICPTGNILPRDKYDRVMNEIRTEAGAIIDKCIKVYRADPRRYRNYACTLFMGLTDPMHNFVDENRFEYRTVHHAVAKTEWEKYKLFCESANITKIGTRNDFLTKFRVYWDEEVARIGNDRSCFVGFKEFMLETNTREVKEEPLPDIFVLDKTESILDEVLKDCPAQYSDVENNKPEGAWDYVTTTLESIDTSREHYVRPGEKLVVIDFDLKDSSGKKSRVVNLKKANESGLPATYAELSKSGEGLHLHYWYAGDTLELSKIYSPNVEIKVYTGKMALRRKVTLCNDLPIATLPVGALPIKEGGSKPMDEYVLENEKHMQSLIKKALKKDVADKNTITCMQYIKHVFDDAQTQGLSYNLVMMKPAIVAFAQHSTNHKVECLALESKIKYSNNVETEKAATPTTELPIAIYDIECFPNQFGFAYQLLDSDDVVIVKHPTSTDAVNLMKNHRLIGFNNAEYDDFMLYACASGWKVGELYSLSKMIVADSKSELGERWRKLRYSDEFRGVKGVSYTDIYSFSSEKKSLKKFQVELGFDHEECHYDWNKNLTEDQWSEVMDYCANDVKTTKALFLTKARQGDYKARLMLSAVTGLAPSKSTNDMTKALIFGDNKHPQDQFNYRFLGDDPGDGRIWFPGYKYEKGVSSYMDVEEVGEGGYVYTNPGTYYHVVTFDVASMHPSSIIAENLFGDEYTQRFKDIKDLRVLIKHKQYDEARTMLGGVFAPYLDDPDDAKNVAQALKIAINSVYGLTSAKFPNQFKDPRNIDNIVAKRGALFMIELRNRVQEMGGVVVHIKTDSIKIENPSQEITDFVLEFGRQYGYTFEIEDRFERLCLIDKAQFIAKLESDDPAFQESFDKGENGWYPKGARFADPYTFKTLFTHQEIKPSDFQLVKSCKGVMYMKRGEDYEFIGKNGSFMCVTDESGVGGDLVKIDNGKESFVTGCKGYKWIDYAEAIKTGKNQYVNLEYYNKAVDDVWADMVAHGVDDNFFD